MANGRPKSRKKLFIFGGIGVVVVALILVVIFGGKKDDIVEVQVQKVIKRNITQTVSATGTINSEFKVKITPEVTGEIVQLPVKEGFRVKKGDLLIKIKPDTYVAEKEAAEANLSSAKSTLQTRKAELDRIQLEYNRTKELSAKGLASQSELEASQSSFLSAKANYAGAQANVDQMQASLRQSIEQLNKTTIYSPMDGTITQLNVELGERVLGSGFSQGTDIMTVSDLGNMEATVEVDENDVVIVSVGDTARIKIDAFSDRVFKGLVTQIGNSAQSTGEGTQEQVVNFDVKVKLIDLDNNLRPGMSCNAVIETETVNNVLSVPIQSVTARSDLNAPTGDGTAAAPMMGGKPKEVVFTVINGKAKAKEVKTGLSDDNFIQIKEGLSDNEEVVTGSYKAISRELYNGSTVRVEKQQKTGTAAK